MSEYVRHFIRMAEYHKWAYERLFEATNKVKDADYRKEIGLFFKSIHGTFNHLLLVDRLWYGRVTQNQIKMTGLDQVVLDDWEEIKKEILIGADKWIELVKGLNEEKLKAEFTYTDSHGFQLQRELGPVLDHVFNHGTHHRGQITAALTSLGYESPSIDLLYFLPFKKLE
eukprot:TRINITY_DN6445_c0_g1_i1.p1 TRINITY_DN6445_c0_g1~~TRINITY_DN6445_c0_g1_i1.p1  ORF type:complete len:180 (-),score=19.88 TRINITY_DN6445_c0_g1_i1:163-672(-)